MKETPFAVQRGWGGVLGGRGDREREKTFDHVHMVFCCGAVLTSLASCCCCYCTLKRCMCTRGTLREQKKCIDSLALYGHHVVGYEVKNKVK